jgi:hypothetical protein
MQDKLGTVPPSVSSNVFPKYRFLKRKKNTYKNSTSNSCLLFLQTQKKQDRCCSGMELLHIHGKGGGGKDRERQTMK